MVGTQPLQGAETPLWGDLQRGGTLRTAAGGEAAGSRSVTSLEAARETGLSRLPEERGTIGQQQSLLPETVTAAGTCHILRHCSL